MKPTAHFISSLTEEAVGVGLILILWSAAAMFFPAYIIPSPGAVLAEAGTRLPPDLPRHLGVTLLRVFTGFSLSLAVGTLLGTLAVFLRWGGQLNALMSALQVLPSMVLGVIFLLVFGIGSAAPILLITFLVLPTLAVNTYNGLQKRSLPLEEYLRTLKSKQSVLFSAVYLPALVPVLQSNLSLGLGLAVKVVVMGEFIGAQDGLGFLLNNARLFLNMTEVFFYLLLLLLATLVFQALQSLCFALFLRKYYYPG